MTGRTAKRGRPRKPSPEEIEALAEAFVREALRPRAIDTSGGVYELVRAIYERGRSDELRAMAKKGASARKRQNLIAKMKRWMVYESMIKGNPQAWRHPHADENLRVLQKALVGAGIKKVGSETIRKDLAEMKRNAAKWASLPASTKARSTPR